MREIKFRAWDGSRIRYDITGFEHGEGNRMEGVFIDGDYYDMKETPVMQCTGLKDKNGTDIYESDIVLAHDSCGKYSGAIEWWNDRWALRFPGSDGTPQNQSLMTVRKPKVIGNIYENPDLLSEPVSNPYKLD